MAKSNSEGAKPVNMMDLLRADMQRKFKDRVFSAEDQFKRMMGLELYSLALQWLIHSNVIPLQSVITLAAPPKTYKTSASLELLRWFVNDQIGGGGLFINTEGKLGPYKVRSLLREYTDRVQVINAENTNRWVEDASQFLVGIHKMMSEMAEVRSKGKAAAAGLGFMPPQGLVIDSVSGAQTESMMTRVASGEAGKTFQDRAQIVTQFLNAWSANLVGLPVTMVLIRHEKPDMNGYGTVTPGGAAPTFHTSLDIRCRFTRNKKQRESVQNGRPHTTYYLDWEVYFSSIGKDGRILTIPYIDTYTENDEQVCWFDWDAALVQLLLRLQKEREYASNLEPVIQILEFDCGNQGSRYGCPQLGIPDRATAIERNMRDSELGRLIQTDPVLRPAVQAALRIQKFTVWTPEIVLPAPGDLPEKVG